MKIIGYKLVKPDYQNAAYFIAQIKFNDIVYEPKFINRLEKAGVLDLWFEPIYETPQIPKGSDAERFADMVECKQKYHKDIGCEKVIFRFETSTVYFNIDGTFSHIF
jgi:hypothetical protein